MMLTRPGMAAVTMALATGLSGCGHTLPKQPDLGRATEPWDPGPPLQLTPHQVGAFGLSQDGSAILMTRHAGGGIVGPNGERTSLDDWAVTLMPAKGGSATWQYRDTRSSQRDSVNNIIAASLNPDGRLLFVEATGPDTLHGYHFPIRYHAELFVLDTASSNDRRTLLRLFNGMARDPTTAPGTLNWLLDLAWVDAESFVALGSYRDLDIGPPLHPLIPLGVVVGTIGPEGATLRLLPGFVGSARIAVAPSRSVIGVDQRSHVVITSLTSDSVLLDVPMPAAPPGSRRALVAVGCTGDDCTVVTHRSNAATWQLWQVDPAAVEPVAKGKSVAGYIPGRGWINPHDRSLLIAASGGLFRISLPPAD